MRRLSAFLLVIPLLAAAAVPAAAQPPTTTDELLAGMVTEEVEPGVYRVINDGVRDIDLVGNTRFVAGYDGSVWLVFEEDGIIRVGSDEAYPWPEGLGADHGLVVTHDGVVWAWCTECSPDGNETALVYSLHEGSWTGQHRGPGAPGPTDPVTLMPDGTMPPTVFVTQSGEVWVGDRFLGDQRWDDDDGAWHEEPGGSLWRYREDDGAWQEITVDAVVVRRWGASDAVEVGADGTVWFAGIEPLMADGEPVKDERGVQVAGESFLMRLDGDEWQRWGPADGVPDLGGGFDQMHLGQAADGGLWVSEPCPEDGGVGGVARFDDPGWRHFLAGHCILQMDVAPDGSVWLKVVREPVDPDDPKPYRLYVITPEAVAATE